MGIATRLYGDTTGEPFAINASLPRLVGGRH